MLPPILPSPDLVSVNPYPPKLKCMPTLGLPNEAPPKAPGPTVGSSWFKLSPIAEIPVSKCLDCPPVIILSLSFLEALPMLEVYPELLPPSYSPLIDVCVSTEKLEEVFYSLRFEGIFKSPDARLWPEEPYMPEVCVFDMSFPENSPAPALD